MSGHSSFELLSHCFLVFFTGTYVYKTCERDQEQGTCLPCDPGQTYTEHPNGMNRCLPCTHCRSGKDAPPKHMLHLKEEMNATTPLLNLFVDNYSKCVTPG